MPDMGMKKHETAYSFNRRCITPSGKLSVTVESGGVLGLTGNCFGRRQRVEGHPLVKRVEATTTADNNYALAA